MRNKNDAWLLIDGNNLLAIQTHAHLSLTSTDGIPTGGMFGCVKKIRLLLLEELAEYNFSRVVFVKDMGRPSYRSKLCPTYKTGREKNRDSRHNKAKGRDGEAIDFHEAYKRQMGLIDPLLLSLGIDIAYLKGWEADDVIAYMAEYASKGPVVVCSGDKDLVQLVDKRVHVYMPVQRELVEKKPRGYLLRRCLEGDKSDNIPGIGGVGPKKATDIIRFVKQSGWPLTPNSVITMVEEFGEEFPHHKLLSGGKCKGMLPEKAKALRNNMDVMSLTKSADLIDRRYGKVTEVSGKLAATKFFKECKRWGFRSLLDDRGQFIAPFGALAGA